MTVGIVTVFMMTFLVVAAAAAAAETQKDVPSNMDRFVEKVEIRSSQIAPTDVNLLATTFVGSGYIFAGQYLDDKCQTLTSATANVLNFCSSYGTKGEFFKVPLIVLLSKSCLFIEMYCISLFYFAVSQTLASCLFSYYLSLLLSSSSSFTFVILTFFRIYGPQR
jgi:hypothetical protein